MIKTTQLELALTEAAELCNPQCVEGSAGHFLVTFAPDESVELVYDETSQCLTFMAEVGRIDDDHAAAGQKLLLEYSFIHVATGGISMALNSVTEQVVQMYRWPVAHLKVPELCTILQNFNRTANLWRTAIAAGLGSGSDAEETLNQDFDLTCALRV